LLFEASNRIYIGAATLLVAALLLGGSGSAAPLHNLLIELIALGVLLLLALDRDIRRRGRTYVVGTALLGLIVVTPFVQLVPMPPRLWTSMPGRDLAAAVHALTSSSSSWRPLSLQPEATLLAAFYVLAPAAIFLSVSRLAHDRRHSIARIIVAGALLSLLLGALQLVGAGDLFLYTSGHNGNAPGLFINRNHQADIHLIGMLFSAALIARSRQLSPGARLALWLTAVVAFSAGVIATTSRMGFLLLPLAVLGSLWVLPVVKFRRRAATVFSCALVVAAFAAVASTARVGRVIERFSATPDARFAFWQDAAFAARQYFPWGSGIGTFDAVFRPIENLDNVGPFYVNHAHNDYLQIVAEAGLWGALLILAFIVFYALICLRLIKDRSTPDQRAACLSVAVLLLHSVGDYPLRILSLLTLFGVFAALLLPPRPELSRTTDDEAKQFE
jgi:O-antigen ligase